MPFRPFFCFCFSFLLLTAIQSQKTLLTPAALRNVPWSASWIAPPQTELTDYGVYHFRKTFTLPQKPHSFVIHISADTRYHLYVNGQSVTLGPQRAADLQHWKYETLDLSPYLQAGKNVLAAWVWNQGENVAWAQFSHQTGLLVQGNSAEEAMVNTDTTWRVVHNNAYTPIATTAHITGPFDQVFAQRYPWGFEKVDYNDADWKSAVITEKAVPLASTEKSTRKLEPRNIPLLEEKEQRFAAVRRMEGLPLKDSFMKGTGSLEVHPWATVTILLDQGVLTTAYPELVVSGGKGCKITVSYAEALSGKFRDDKGNRNEIEGKQILQADHDVFLLDGGAQRLFRPLWYRTFRYVALKIENHQLPLTIHDYKSRFSAYPFKENAAFKSNDTSLHNIWNVGWRTARLCAYETYMDCPYFEQLQYIGDTRIQALISIYVSGDDRLMKNAIEQFYQSQLADGLTYSRYPSNLKQVIPPFSLFWISMIHDYWMLRKDDAFVKALLPGIQKVLSWHKQYINKNNMLGKMPYWHFVDWPEEWPWKGTDEVSGVPAGALEGNSSILTLQYVYALNKAAELYAGFGNNAAAKESEQLAQRLRTATYKQCWDDAKQMLADTPDKTEYSQHANVMAVLAGAIPTKEEQALLRRIAADTSIIQCTIYYRFYLNQAFKKAGLGNEYVSMLHPWHNMLQLGLTTFAERPEPSRSDCHAWSVSPNYDLLATVCGIEPARPGFAAVRITPHLGKLQWVQGSMPHPMGTITVDLKRNGNGITGEVSLPQNVQGIFNWQGKQIALRGGVQKIDMGN